MSKTTAPSSLQVGDVEVGDLELHAHGLLHHLFALLRLEQIVYWLDATAHALAGERCWL